MRITLLSVSFVLLSWVSAMAQLAPVQIGRASNAFTILRSEQNQVVADQNSNSVAFIHRQDVTIWGGGTAANGRLRYDLSTDGGASFTNDIGILNNTYTQPARYPQMINFGNNANPFNNSFIWTAPNINPAGGWDGFVNGLSTVTTSAPFSTELYNEIGNNSLLQGGLCEGLSGEFWQVEFKANGQIASDTLRILKGSYVPVSGNVVWSIYENVYIPHNTPFGGISVVGPNMMFSPSGQDGWVGFLGDLVGGADTTFNPIFVHSSDGGASWGAPMEVDLSTVTFEGGGNTLVQELQALWEDSPGVPTSSGKPTCTFEYDITVDANGNPHMFVVVASASTTGFPTSGYTVFPDLAKLAVDVYSEDGGATWKAAKVSPVYAFRDQWGTPDPNTGGLLTMDNVPQVSRTQDGSKIFYSWVDSDTTITGFGNNVNSAPNLRIAGRRISDGFMTCPKWITLGDATWDGEMLFPTMAPEVLTSNGGTTYKLPIVSLDMLIDDQNAPCQFWYWGGEATLDDSDFFAPASVLISDNCSIGGVERKPILEVYNGTWAMFGPNIEVLADPLLAANPQLSRITSHIGDGLEIPDGALVNFDLVIGYPSGSIDRVLFSGETHVAVNIGDWAARVAERLNSISPVSVELQNLSYNPVTRLLQVTVASEFYNSVSGDLRFNLTLVEDSVTGYPQQNFYDTQPGHPYFGAGNPVVNFYHRNVIREHLGGAWGTAGVIPGTVGSGDTYSTTYSYTLPAGIDEDQVSIIGFVSEYGVGVDQRQMLNSSGLVPLSAGLQPPVNDDVCNAIPLNLGVNGPFDVTLATAQSGEATPPIGSDPGINPGCQSQDGWCSIGGEPMVDNSTWYTFVAPASGNVTLSLDGSTFDTQVAVWSASSCNDLLTGAGTFVGGNDDNPNFLISQYSSEVTVTCLTPGAIYYVQVDGYQGSEGDALITMVDNNYVADATISATSLLVCDGVDETLSAPAGAGFTYAWFGAINSQTLSTSAAGPHWVLVTDTNGCVASDTVNITTGDTPTAAFTYSTSGLTVNFMDVFMGALDSQSYTFGDGNGSTNASPTYTYSASGTYTVCHSVSNACGSDVNCQSVTVDITTGIDEAGLGSASIYPNPSQGFITLELNGVEGQVQMTLLDVMGRAVHSQSLNVSPSFRQTFEFNVAPGTYVLQLQTDEAIASRKLELR